MQRYGLPVEGKIYKKITDYCEQRNNLQAAQIYRHRDTYTAGRMIRHQDYDLPNGFWGLKALAGATPI